MWLLAIAAGVVVAVVAMLLAGRVQRAGHQALGRFLEWAPLPALGASVFVALGLAHHHGVGSLGWVLLAYVGVVITLGLPGKLVEWARLVGPARLASFVEWVSLPLAVVLLWVTVGLAQENINWTDVAVFPVAYVGWAALHALWRRRRNA